MESSTNKRVKLGDLLLPRSIQLHLMGQDRDAVLQELVDQIQEIADRPDARHSLFEALKEREKLHSTGIGDGVALPHARNALVGLVNHPVVVFGRHDTGILFDAIDGMPVKIFFLLIAPTVTEHLGIIARLSRVLRNPKTRQALLAADSAEKVIQVLKEAESAM